MSSKIKINLTLINIFIFLAIYTPFIHAGEEADIEAACCRLEEKGEELKEKGQSMRQKGMALREDGKEFQRKSCKIYTTYSEQCKKYEEEILLHKVEMQNLRDEGIKQKKNARQVTYGVTGEFVDFNHAMWIEGNRKIVKWNKFCEQWKNSIHEIGLCAANKKDTDKQACRLLTIGAEQMNEGMNCYFGGCDLIRDAEIFRLHPESEEEVEILRKEFRKRDTGVEEFTW